MVNYRKGEPVWADEWISAYTGRGYGFGARVGAIYDPSIMAGASEVFSMWWTNLIKDPVGFMAKDPGHFEWGYKLILKLQGLQ